MSPIAIKRIKLLFCITCIPIIIGIFTLFFHNAFLIPYLRNETELMSQWFREELYREIREGVHTESEVKILWDLSIKDSVKTIKIANLSFVIQLLYCTIAFFTMVFTAILTKWYESKNKNLVITDMSKEK